MEDGKRGERRRENHGEGEFILTILYHPLYFCLNYSTIILVSSIGDSTVECRV